jgi:hypothetical protein
MDRTPSLWRAWSPLILQLAGVAVVAVGIALASSSITPFAMIAGSGVWFRIHAQATGESIAQVHNGPWI